MAKPIRTKKDVVYYQGYADVNYYINVEDVLATAYEVKAKGLVDQTPTAGLDYLIEYFQALRDQFYQFEMEAEAKKWQKSQPSSSSSSTQTSPGSNGQEPQYLQWWNITERVRRRRNLRQMLRSSKSE